MALSELSSFTKIQEIGRGGFGKVYKAWDVDRCLEVAIKVFVPSGKIATKSRFFQEILAIKKCRDNRVVEVYDSGEMLDGSLWYSMELCKCAVTEQIKTLGYKKRIEYCLDVLKAVSALHASGVAHRDIKPDNMFLGFDDKVKIGDFGLAKSVSAGDQMNIAHTPAETILGTQRYLAPEIPIYLLKNKLNEVDWLLSDQFATSVTVYKVLSDQYPFRPENADIKELVAHAMRGEYVPIHIKGVTPANTVSFDRILRKGVNSNPATRYPSINDMLNEFTSVCISKNIL